ncbi:GNAT family N-acetyltransferase [Aliikangiella sp. G2MR2-5]|uniref:GNAT family N-acetyltransferase n=1 Tax=Aliikangiella sp. G2MR2-5 TaxID=2788943 RepID=UPI0018AA788D|nr:GNAT family N-acetyltransferase [Aliikangiella sp. G2MR2-5]
MTDNKITISFEQANAKDLPFLTASSLALQEFESKDEDLPLSLNKNFEKEIYAWLSEEINNPSSLLFLINSENRDIGFAFIKILSSPNSFTEYKSFGLIQSIWIEPEYRKKNIGKQVVALAEEIFKEQNIPYYEVNFTATNKTAEDFWKQCGLRVTSKTARKFL